MKIPPTEIYIEIIISSYIFVFKSLNLLTKTLINKTCILFYKNKILNQMSSAPNRGKPWPNLLFKKLLTSFRDNYNKDISSYGIVRWIRIKRPFNASIYSRTHTAILQIHYNEFHFVPDSSSPGTKSCQSSWPQNRKSSNNNVRSILMQEETLYYVQ